MLKFCFFATILFFSAWKAVDAQEEYISNLIYKFPAYVQQKGLDPSDIYTGTFAARPYRMRAEFTNHQLIGYSVDNESVHSVVFYLPTDTRLGSLSLFIDFGNPNTTIEGNYKINGTYYQNVAVSGEGRWTISSKSIFVAHLDYRDIPLSDDGLYVDLKNAGTKYGFIHNTTAEQMDYKMDGLLAGGQEEAITGDVMSQLFQSLGYVLDLPMSEPFMKFFEDEFEKTPIADMF